MKIKKLKIKEILFSLNCYLSPFNIFPENPKHHWCYNPLIDAAYYPYYNKIEKDAAVRDHLLEISHRYLQPFLKKCSMRRIASVLYDAILHVALDSPKYLKISYENIHQYKHLLDIYYLNFLLSKIFDSAVWVDEIFSLWNGYLSWKNIRKMDRTIFKNKDLESWLQEGLKNLEKKYTGISDLFENFFWIYERIGYKHSCVLFFYSMNSPTPSTVLTPVLDESKFFDPCEKLSGFRLNQYPFSPKERFERALYSLEKYIKKGYVGLHKLMENEFYSLLNEIIPDFSDVYFRCNISNKKNCYSKSILERYGDCMAIYSINALSALICDEVKSSTPLDDPFDFSDRAELVKRQVSTPFFTFGSIGDIKRRATTLLKAEDPYNLWSLIIFESLRQQIFLSKGLYCPYYNNYEGTACMPNIEKVCSFKKVFKNLIKRVAFEPEKKGTCIS